MEMACLHAHLRGHRTGYGYEREASAGCESANAHRIARARSAMQSVTFTDHYDAKARMPIGLREHEV